MERAEIARELTREYGERRDAGAAEQRRRVERACGLDPEIRALIRANAEAISRQAKALIGSPEGAAERIEAFAAELFERRAEIARRLRNIGLPEDELERKYACGLCKDTGYADVGSKARCACFERELGERLFRRQGGAVGLGQRFESFDEAVFPTGPSGSPPSSQRDRSVRAMRLCLDYAERFPETDRLNLMLFGASGLGKSFLLNCVAARISERGYPVIRLTAYRLFEAMRATHLGEEEGERRFRELTECPFLSIDDLGTEPVYRNVTGEYLFLLMNERNQNRRHTAVATNLSPDDLMARYGERTHSRLFAETAAIQFVGEDLRTLRRGSGGAQSLPEKNR